MTDAIVIVKQNKLSKRKKENIIYREYSLYNVYRLLEAKSIYLFYFIFLTHQTFGSIKYHRALIKMFSLLTVL